MPTQLLDEIVTMPNDTQVVDPATGQLNPAWQHYFGFLDRLSQKLVDTELLTEEDLEGEEAVIEIGPENLKDDFGVVILQRGYLASTANGSTTATIGALVPPLATDGTEILTLNFAPRRGDSRIRVRYEMMYHYTDGSSLISLICVTGEANAVGFRYQNYAVNVVPIGTLEVDIPSWGTDERAVSVRIGPASSNTIWYNRFSGSVPFGDAQVMTLWIEEYKATPIPAA